LFCWWTSSYELIFILGKNTLSLATFSLGGLEKINFILILLHINWPIWYTSIPIWICILVYFLICELLHHAFASDKFEIWTLLLFVNFNYLWRPVLLNLNYWLGLSLYTDRLWTRRVFVLHNLRHFYWHIIGRYFFPLCIFLSYIPFTITALHKRRFIYPLILFVILSILFLLPILF